MSAPKASVLKVAPPYDDDLILQIKRGFTKKLGFDVNFEVIEDSSLLCGFIAYINGIVYDVSGKTQLTGICRHLVDSVLVMSPAASEGEGS